MGENRTEKSHLQNILWHFCEGPVLMERVLKKCCYQHFEQFPGNFFFKFLSRYREIVPFTIYMPNLRSIGPSKQKLQGGGGQILPSPSHTNLQKARPV